MLFTRNILKVVIFLVYLLVNAQSFSIPSWKLRNLDKLSRGTALGDTKTTNALVDARTQALQTLKQEKERKLMSLAATELAIKSVEEEIEKEMKATPQKALLLSNVTYDYGFISKSSGCYVDTETAMGKSNVPSNALDLGVKSFKREFQSILDIFSKNETAFPSDDIMQMKLKSLKLSNKAIWDREKGRPEVEAPLVIKVPYYLLCFMLDFLFEGRPISRFWFLETVARMPYFSYITMLHTYETLGWWRRSAISKRVHFAEEWNEYHHLLIMESLGGDQEWAVRFFAQHASIIYFFVLIFLWTISPSLAYNFSELIEAHAVDTYAEFAYSNREILQTMPAPKIAKAYYEAQDLYSFDEFQTNRPKGSRRPRIENLYDVFCNIRDDEAEHVATMSSCQDPNVVLKSPNTEAAVLAASAAAAAIALLTTGGDTDLSSLTSIFENAFSGQSVSDFLATSGAAGAGAAAMSSVAGEGTEEMVTAGAGAVEAMKDAKIISTILQWLRVLIPFI